MKLILREYLSSLREREELDAILPDLLSELGFTVYSRPQRGTVQHGVDIAAISPATSGEQKVYLFSVKKGDLTRHDWNGSPQALRPSLEDILDAYIRNRIPVEYSQLKIVICLCFGGDVHEQVRASVTGFMKDHTTDLIGFEEWNGDKIAGLLLEGVLREDLLPKPFRSNFQKAVALLDEPDVAYRHFALLVEQLRTSGGAGPKNCIRAARQIYICLWVLFVWARDAGNMEAPYQASELALLNIWELLKPLIGREGRDNEALTRVLNQLIQVHVTIALELVESRITPHSTARDALAVAVESRSSVDVNLKLFDILGRIGMTGLWLHWIGERREAEEHASIRAAVVQLCDLGLSIIDNNATLRLPVADEQATDIALFLLLWAASETDASRLITWLAAMVHRYEFTVLTLGRYPTSLRDYRDWINRPRERSEEYFEEATAGSTLIPLLAAWATGIGRIDFASRLAELAAKKLPHTTMQLWTPDQDSEEHLYINSESHGRAICDLPIKETGAELLETISEACKGNKGFEQLSANQTGYWPIVLLACRHWRLPIPPNFYIDALRSAPSPVSDAISQLPEEEQQVAAASSG